MYCSVYKAKGSKLYRGKFKVIGSNEVINVSLDAEKKDIAQAQLKRIKERADRKALGLPCIDTLQEEAGQPIQELLNSFLVAQSSKCNSAAHIKHVRLRLNRIIKETGWTRLTQITPANFCSWRNTIKNLCAKTLNEYLGHLLAFLNWLVKQGKLQINPLLNKVDKVSTQGKKTFERRSFTDDEMIRLRKSPEGRGWIYLAATMMGLRRNEFKQLRWDNVKLDVPKPFLIVPASVSKNRRMACLEMPPDGIEAFKALKGIIYSSRPQDLVLPRGIPNMKVFREDLELAGIPYINEMGRRADFHALRHTTDTRMLAFGISPRVVQAFLRHSDIRLTTNTYTDVLNLPIGSELKKLPSLLPPADLNSVQPSIPVSEPVKREVSEKAPQPASVVEKVKVWKPLTVPVKIGQIRRGGDSNPRYGLASVQRFSKPPHSATLPPLLNENLS